MTYLITNMDIDTILCLGKFKYGYVTSVCKISELNLYNIKYGPTSRQNRVP